VQLEDMRETTGANHLSLIDCQHNYLRKGACEKRLIPYVRTPRPDEKREEGWRTIDRILDFVDVEINYEPGDPYHWRPLYWKRIALQKSK
jgi:hypothetical protein